MAAHTLTHRYMYVYTFDVAERQAHIPCVHKRALLFCAGAGFTLCPGRDQDPEPRTQDETKNEDENENVKQIQTREPPNNTYVRHNPPPDIVFEIFRIVHGFY